MPRLLGSDASWEQWGGPTRDFRVNPIPEMESLKRPSTVWQRSLGLGHSAIVANADHGFTTHLDDNHDVLTKWRIADGRIAWESRRRVTYHSPTKAYDGPHTTPVLSRNQVLTVNNDALVRSFDIETGRERWKVDLKQTCGTTLPQSGYASSPLIWQNLLIVPTLGIPQPSETERFAPNLANSVKTVVPGAVALDLLTGDEVWRTDTFRSSHSSPVLIEVNDQPVIVFHGMFELLGIDPRQGNVLFRQLLRKSAADNVSFTPIWDPSRQQILISHGYCNFGTQAIRLQNTEGGWSTNVAWTNRRMRLVHTNAVMFDEVLLGASESITAGIDVRDGTTLFRQRGFGEGNFLAVGSEVLLISESGELIAGKPGRDGIELLWRMRVFKDQPAWTVPTLVGDRLLLRNVSQLKQLRFQFVP